MPDSVHVRYTKWDGSLHWHFDSVVVDRDDHGTWLLVGPGGWYRRGDEPARRDEHGFIVLIPADGWWSAYFNSSHAALVYRPDPTTKPEFVQPRSVIEVLPPPIEGLTAGSPVALWLHPEQASFVT